MINNAQNKSRNVAAFISESLVSCGGQVVLPPDYLKTVYRYVREAGGVCIADEVQVGFGRVGSHMWGFQTQGQDVVPDIVTLGKPIGNGHPIACVVTTPEIAKSFEMIGTEYFNTYGGNPVSLAIAGAVLDVIERQKLQQHADQVGKYMLPVLRRLQRDYPVIGDVRGMGLFLGLDLVTDRISKEPATEVAEFMVRRFKEQGIIMSTEGKYGNVLKFKPPMVFSMSDAQHLLSVLEAILREVKLQAKVTRSLSSLSTASTMSTVSSSSSPGTSDDEDSSSEIAFESSI
jgi:ethanolamine-phosphate phospho-lyase